MTTLLGAMDEMAEAMTAVNASRRQVRGVGAWRDQVAAAVLAGQEAGAGHAGQLAGTVPGSHTHGQWMTTADAIIATLASHAAEAEEMAGEARELADEARGEEKRFRAQQASCEQRGLSEGAAMAGTMAANAAQEAEEAEERVEACEAWAAAATDAAAQGAALTASEDAIHQPVGRAIADAGGRAWIADDKTFITGGA
jgi:hypothetical protein